MPKYTARERLEIIKEVIIKGKSVVQVCRQYRISRTLFYRWLSRYKQAVYGKKRKALAAKKRKIILAKNQVASKIEREILKIVKAYPHYSFHKIAQILPGIGNHGVQNVLKRLNLNTFDKRIAFAKKHSLVVPLYKKRVIERVILGREPVAKVCREYGISRTIFYRWLNRYEEGGRKLDVLWEKIPEVKCYWRQATNKQIETILKIVIEHPEYSTHKIAEILPWISNHGVQNIFRRQGLNTYEKRLAYAQAQAPVITPAIGLLDRVKSVWEKFILG